MFRALSAKILSPLGSKKPSKTSMREGGGGDGAASPRDIRIDFATTTRKGKMHANEDRAVIIRRFPSGETQEKKDLSPPPSPASTGLGTGQQAGKLQLSNMKYIAVFDGHGGSQCAVYMREHLHEHILLSVTNDNGTVKCDKFQDLRFYIPDAFKAADDEFCELYPNNTSGSCGVVALIHGREMLIAHVGDCRAILRCNGETIPLTRDHRPSNLEEHRRVVSMGGTIVDGRVCGVLSPSRSFGDTDVRAEFGDGVVISEPDITYVALETSADVAAADASPSARSDSSQAAATAESEQQQLPKPTSSTSSTPVITPYTFLLLSSDGVFEEMDREEACQVLETGLRRFAGDPVRAVDRLIKVASAHSQDDCTVILAVWNDGLLDTPTRAKSQRYLLHQRQASTEDEETPRDEESAVEHVDRDQTE